MPPILINMVINEATVNLSMGGEPFSGVKCMGNKSFEFLVKRA